jgi:alkylation response protein AidB-like acyl-CoA dehydrogenase
MNKAHAQMLAEIRKLAPRIAVRAAEIEAARRTPPDLIAALRSIGVFRMFAPRSHDGLELALPAGLEVIRALARIDGSIDWNATIVHQRHYANVGKQILSSAAATGEDPVFSIAS